eukprot:2266-Heterococcus_DN1.PRE.1
MLQKSKSAPIAAGPVRSLSNSGHRGASKVSPKANERSSRAHCTQESQLHLKFRPAAGAMFVKISVLSDAICCSGCSCYGVIGTASNVCSAEQ